MHEFKQFIDDCLQEPPVGAKEAGVLPNNVHDVGGDDGLVVFASLLFAQSQQVLFEGKGHKRHEMTDHKCMASQNRSQIQYPTNCVWVLWPHWYKSCHIFVCTTAHLLTLL